MKKINKEYSDPLSVGEQAKQEITQGLEMLKNIKLPIITFYGSHIGNEGDTWYDHAYSSAKKLGEKGFALMSGGGPGIMHAANKGAMDAKSQSIGIIADLIKGETVDESVFTHSAYFDYIFVRRFILSIQTEAMVFYPGGFGTFNELFEFLVLMQTNITKTVPIILVGKKFWSGMLEWSTDVVLKDKYITQEHMDLITVVDSVDGLVEHILQKT
jgi:uncharacterized protein (TIGR00730 family)